MFKINNKQKHHEPVRFIYIGSVLPDRTEFDSKAFSRAGSLWQENLLKEMKSCEGIQLDAVVSYRQVETSPRSERLWVKSEVATLNSGIQVKLLPFLNLTPFKQIAIGIGALKQILLWGIRTRYTNNRFVFLYNLSVPSIIFIYIGCKISKVKLIASINDIEIPGITVPKTFLHRIDHYLQCLLIPKLDGHVVVSDKIMQDFAPNSEYIRVEGGISPEIVSRCSQAKVAFANSVERYNKTFKIVSFGSLEEINGFNVLIEAFQIIRNKGITNVELYIAGKGSMEQVVIEAAKRDSSVKYLGYVSHDEVLNYYAKADLLVNLRLINNINSGYFFPSKLLEYLSSGTAVMTTRVGQVSSDLDGVVFFLDEESPQYVAEKLIEIINTDPAVLIEKGKSAVMVVERDKTWPRQASKIMEYIKGRIGCKSADISLASD